MNCVSLQQATSLGAGRAAIMAGCIGQAAYLINEGRQAGRQAHRHTEQSRGGEETEPEGGRYGKGERERETERERERRAHVMIHIQTLTGFVKWSGGHALLN